jgi:branched-subunit amino acid transport protein
MSETPIQSAKWLVALSVLLCATVPCLAQQAPPITTSQLTIPANAVSPSPPATVNVIPGTFFTVIFVQNGTTACTWTWPSTIHGGGTVAATLGGISTQQFIVSANGTDAYPVSAMQSTTGGTP